MILETIKSPADLRALGMDELTTLAAEIREFIVQAVSVTGGHLGSNLGAVELTLAVHRVFDSPRDIILWDTGHQAYVHKIVTGPAGPASPPCARPGGLSGYPSRGESEHDWVENSHASTDPQLRPRHRHRRRARAAPTAEVVAVIGDGSMTGGMAFEGLNNLGHTRPPRRHRPQRQRPVLRADGVEARRERQPPAPQPGYVATGATASSRSCATCPPSASWRTRRIQGLKAAIREMRRAARRSSRRSASATSARSTATTSRASRTRCATPPSTTDRSSCTCSPRRAAATRRPRTTTRSASTTRRRVRPRHRPARRWSAPDGLHRRRSPRRSSRSAERHPQVVAITAAMPGPTGLLPFQARVPRPLPRRRHRRAARGHRRPPAWPWPGCGRWSPSTRRSSPGRSTRPMYDVGLHGLPVVFALDRAGITGDDGPSHHGVLDMALCLPRSRA